MKTTNHKTPFFPAPIVFMLSFSLLLGSALAKEESETKTAKKNESINMLYAHYLDMHKALSKDNLEKAKQAGKKLADSKALGEKAKEFNQADDINQARKEFMDISNKMIAMMKETDYKGEKDVLLYHCPMANDNKGADWLQSEEGTANPYYGSQMYACGSKKADLSKAGSKAEKQQMKKKMKGHEKHHHH